MRKLKAVRAIVRPDRRSEYLDGWDAYAESARALGANAWLFEDQQLTGRFMEFIEFEAAPGTESKLKSALDAARLPALCVRREGDDLIYREVGAPE